MKREKAVASIRCGERVNSGSPILSEKIVFSFCGFLSPLLLPDVPTFVRYRTYLSAYPSLAVCYT